MKRAIIAVAATILFSTQVLAQEEFLSLETFLEEPHVQCNTKCCGSLKGRPAQTYSYYQNTGHFVGGSGAYRIDTRGYSGAGSGLMNPAKQCVKNTGPLPAARYKLGYCKDTMHTPAKTRPCSFYLEPQEPSKMCGRSAFFVHGCGCCGTGDTTTPPVAGCSAGCVVINQAQREKLRVGDTVNVYQYEGKALTMDYPEDYIEEAAFESTEDNFDDEE